MNYTSVKVPKRLVEMFYENKKAQSLGYRSFSEFALEATRLRVLELLSDKAVSK